MLNNIYTQITSSQLNSVSQAYSSKVTKVITGLLQIISYFILRNKSHFNLSVSQSRINIQVKYNTKHKLKLTYQLSPLNLLIWHDNCG